ncbi:MAG: ligase-associated DNA damage response exonuclease [Chitinophagaceae bacterium]
MPLISFTDKGFYCEQGNFYVDPIKPVDYAVITHAHSDHARWGSQYYLCHTYTQPLLQLRLGNVVTEAIGWGEKKYINGVELSLHPSGHIVGASQVRIAYKGEVWVISGDYKLENDGISGSFEPIACHHFISESTFALPIYQWQPQEHVYNDMRQWVLSNIAANQSSVFLAYSLGKAQRVIQALAPLQLPIFVHGAIANTQKVINNLTVASFPEVYQVTAETPKEALKNAIVVAPPSVENAAWLNKFGAYQLSVCSGWMQVRGNGRRQNIDKGFVLSDHADWQSLLEAFKLTKAENIWLTHGFQSVMCRYLNEVGKQAYEVPPFWMQSTNVETELERG